MDAEIIAVGSELLLGQIANTNAQYLSQRLSQLGINVYYHIVVGDNHKRIFKSLDTAFNRVDIIITTGGLGPTMDDLTKEIVAEYLNVSLVLHEPSVQALKKFFEKRGREVSENNYKQTYFPENAIVLPNEQGTAPGAIIEKDGKIFIILPGPPNELQPMFEKYVIPYLESKGYEKITSRILRIYGMGESLVEDKIKDILINQTNPTIAPLAGSSEVTLRLTAKCGRGEDPYQLIHPIEDEIRRRLGDVVYGIDNDTLEGVVVRLLTQHKQTITIAESCTGGMIAQRITSIPGASQAFTEGVVCYSNESKIRRLGISQETLKTHGAVSTQTAKEMVRGILNNTGANIGIGVTGIAGPEGGSPEKPVGLVYIGIGNQTGYLDIEAYNIQGDRTKIQYTASSIALDRIRRMLISL